MSDFVRLLAAWALVHESADEGWKAAITRGQALAPGEMHRGSEAFVDGLAALVAEEKERLKSALSAGSVAEAAGGTDLAAALEAVRFELAELRGRVESLQASVDALAARRRD
jgi:hypothetical protein